MKTIHDEEKIEELFVLADSMGGWEQEVIYNAMKEYAEHIRLKTIDEAIACVQEEFKGDCWADIVAESPENIITKLEQLKK